MFSLRWTEVAVFASVVLFAAAPLAATKSRPQPSKPRHAISSTKHTSAKSLSTHASSPHLSSTRAASTHATVARHAGKGSHKTEIKAVAAKPKFRGQQSIDSARTIEIQQALIREHYLDGEPTGVWDQATRDALVRLQDEQHWQTRIVPDSRALIKLGLGPSQQNLLNPETAAMAPAAKQAFAKGSSGTTN